MDENLSRGYVQLGKARGINDFNFSKGFKHLSPPIDNYNCIYLALMLGGVGFLLPYNRSCDEDVSYAPIYSRLRALDLRRDRTDSLDVGFTRCKSPVADTASGISLFFPLRRSSLRSDRFLLRVNVKVLVISM